MLRLCNKAEPLVKRSDGRDSYHMGVLMRFKAKALRIHSRFIKARIAALESLRILDKVSGRGEDYIHGLIVLIEILLDDKDYEEGINRVREALSLHPADPGFYSQILNLQVLILIELAEYKEAREVHEELLATSLLREPESSNHAFNCISAGMLYAELNQMEKASRLASEALGILQKTLGPSHQNTQTALSNLKAYQQALTDPAIKEKLVPTKNRMCNIEKCGNIERAMSRCMSCMTFYVCKEHEGKINEHVSVCPKFPDVLPGEKKLFKIVKCRRCRKETKLMKCSVCESVWYCGATCQKEDWKRHKLFCGKK